MDKDASKVVMIHDVKLDEEYTQWLNEIKARYRNAQIKAAVKVNAEQLLFNWQLGQDLVIRKAEERWGSGIVEQVSLDLQAVGEMARLKAADYGHEEGDLAEGIRAFCASISNDGFSPITSLEPMMWVDATYERLLDPQAAHDLVLRFAGVCSVALGEPSLRAMPSVPKPRRGV